MPTVNKVFIIGHCGAAPTITQTAAGLTVAKISVATSESWKDKQSGDKKDRTEWHRIVFFGRLAEIVQDYVGKGSLLYVEGALRTNKWQDSNGQDRYTTEIIGKEMQMLSRKTEETPPLSPFIDGGGVTVRTNDPIPY